MKRIFIFFGLILILLIAGCTAAPVEESPKPTATTEPTAVPADTPTPRPTMTPKCTTWEPETIDPEGLDWWNETVFYEIFVRSFYDSDGDGIGDFNGIIEKLDYLNDGDPTTNQDLGITGIWLMPINASPSYHGYDVTDYYAVNPEFGTLEDFQNLLEAAHERGISIIIDMVLNHTSTKHPWFEAAAADPDSEYRDFFIWADPPPSFESPWGSDVWHDLESGSYYGIFWAGMPDLNYENPAVTAEMQEVIRFWLEDVGVDGFRLDAIKHLIEDGDIQENTPATHAWWEGFFDHYTSINPQALTVGEAWTSTDEVVKYIGDEMNIAFEFDTSGAMLESSRSETNRYIQQAHQLVLASYPPHQYATFLTNHDQGRVMSELRNKDGQAKTAASLLLTGPGVPFLYYGEEIGHTGRKPDENIRTPMQWSDEKYAGFTSADLPWRRPQDDYTERNVATQTADATSLLSHYRALIQARNENPALQTGSFFELPTSDRRLYAFLRYTEEQTLLVLINMSKTAIDDYRFCLSEGTFQSGTATEILHNSDLNPLELNRAGGFDVYQPIDVLEAFSTYIIELE